MIIKYIFILAYPKTFNMALQLCVLILIFNGNFHLAYARPSTNDIQTETNAIISATVPSAGQDLASLGTTYSENLVRNTTVVPWSDGPMHNSAFSWLEHISKPRELTPYEMKIQKIILLIIFSCLICLSFVMLIILVIPFIIPCIPCTEKDPREPYMCCDWFRPQLYRFEYESLP